MISEKEKEGDTESSKNEISKIKKGNAGLIMAVTKTKKRRVPARGTWVWNAECKQWIGEGQSGAARSLRYFSNPSLRGSRRNHNNTNTRRGCKRREKGSSLKRKEKKVRHSDQKGGTATNLGLALETARAKEYALETNVLGRIEGGVRRRRPWFSCFLKTSILRTSHWQLWMLFASSERTGANKKRADIF